MKRRPPDPAALLGLATIARLTYDYSAAEQLYARVHDERGTSQDLYRVHAWMGQAAIAYTRFAFSDAEALLEQAAAQARPLGYPGLAGEALVTLGWIRSRTRGASAADSTHAEAMRVIPPDDARRRAALGCARAGVLAGRGLPAARDSALAARALADGAAEHRVRALCDFVLAQDFLRVGRIDSAVATFGRVAEEQRRLRDRANLATTLQWRGWAMGQTGRFGDAFAALHQAVAEGRASGNRVALAWAELNLAEISLRVGDLNDGAAHAARAAELLEAQGDQVGLAGIRGLQADLARAAGRFAEARLAYREALAVNRRVGRYLAYVPIHRALAELAAALGEPEEAERELAEARRVAREHAMPRWELGLNNQSATLALRRGDLPAAEQALTRLLAAPLEPAPRYAARAQLAYVHALRGDVSAAERELSGAIDQLDRWRAGLTERDLRVLASQVQANPLDPDLAVATVLATLAAGGRVEPAFELAERRRARELLDRLVRGDALRTTADAAPVTPARTAAAYRAVTLAEVRARLPDSQTALLAYVTGRGGEATTLFVVTRAGAVALALPPIDSLAAEIARLGAVLEGGGDAPALARSLGAAVLQPAVEALPAGVDRLIVVPDDALHRVPFDALLLADGRPAIDRFSITIAPSAAVLLRLWNRSARTAPPALLALGDPAFGGAPAPSPTGDGPLPRLPASGREARAVARYALRADVRLRDQASETWLKAAPLEQYAVLHLATHAIVDDRSATRTAIVLAPGGDDDGWLRPGDLSALRLDADLVVLSACRTAGGVVVRGEGVQGLTAPLLEAGARAVLATGWRVSDRSIVPLVEDFYAGLARGLGAGDALRAAKLAARARGAPVSDWAAFTLVGDPLVRVSLRAPRRGGRP